jgi:hypothetical protein
MNKKKFSLNEVPAKGEAILKVLNHKKELQTAESEMEDNNFIEKYKLVESVMKEEQGKNFDKLLKEEFDRIHYISDKKRLLRNINLIEKNVNHIYNWNELVKFHNPISHYTKLDYNNKFISKQLTPPQLEIINAFQNNQNITDCNISNINEDIQQNKKNTKGYQRHLSSKNLALKYSSLYSVAKTFNFTKQKKTNEDESNEFSLKKRLCYVTSPEDVKQMVGKCPSPKPKVIIDKVQLKKLVKEIKKENKSQNRKKLYKDPLIIHKQDLLLATNEGIVEPLLTSIYHQTHKDTKVRSHKRRITFRKKSTPIQTEVHSPSSSPYQQLLNYRKVKSPSYFINRTPINSITNNSNILSPTKRNRFSIERHSKKHFKERPLSSNVYFYNNKSCINLNNDNNVYKNSPLFDLNNQAEPNNTEYIPFTNKFFHSPQIKTMIKHNIKTKNVTSKKQKQNNIYIISSPHVNVPKTPRPFSVSFSNEKNISKHSSSKLIRSSNKSSNKQPIINSYYFNDCIDTSFVEDDQQTPFRISSVSYFNTKSNIFNRGLRLLNNSYNNSIKKPQDKWNALFKS